MEKTGSIPTAPKSAEDDNTHEETHIELMNGLHYNISTISGHDYIPM